MVKLKPGCRVRIKENSNGWLGTVKRHDAPNGVWFVDMDSEKTLPERRVFVETDLEVVDNWISFIPSSDVTASRP